VEQWLIVALLAGICIFLALPPVALAWLVWRGLHSRRVVVNLKSGRALDGLLVRRSADLLFLRNATVMEPGAEPARLDGEAVIARADVDFIQAL
jgi:small nuclear ribonucleoprotein (snRNP)-like protein